MPTDFAAQLEAASQDADATMGNKAVESAVHTCREIAPEHELEGPPLLESLGEIDGPPLLETLGEVEEPTLLECVGIVEDGEGKESESGEGGDDVGDGSDAPAEEEAEEK
jgi:hypothetical protein